MYFVHTTYAFISKMHTNFNTVEPLFKDHPVSQEKVVSKVGWSFFRGVLFTMKT